MTFPHGSGQAMHKSSSRTTPSTPTPVPDRNLDNCLKENDGDTNGDVDSVVSFAPSTSGKNIAHWFSGLLGRS